MKPNLRKTPGRKSLSGQGPSKTVQAKVSPAQAATFKAMGGARWLRDVLDMLDEQKLDLTFGATVMGVVFKKDGKYFRYVEHTTHTGTHQNTEWVENLQRATVFNMLPPHVRQLEELTTAERLSATETRTVTLTLAARIDNG